LSLSSSDERLIRNIKSKKENIISTPLTQEQRSELSNTLRAQLNALNRQVEAHRQVLSNDDYPQAEIEQNTEDAAQHSDDDEVEAALSDIDRQELSSISRALERIKGDDYGLCVDCGRQIPFDRLEREPQTLRCLSCEAPYELSSTP